MKKQRIWILVALAGIAASASGYLVWRESNAYLYSYWDSPDRDFRVEVYSYPELLGHMPGDSGGASGYVRLVELRSGRTLKQKGVDMVMLIDAVYWGMDSVRIKLFAEWPLPKG